MTQEIKQLIKIHEYVFLLFSEIYNTELVKIFEVV